MKIAQVMAGAAVGGAELYYERLSSALAAAGDSILPVIRSNQARSSRLTAAGLFPVELKFGGRFDFSTKRNLQNLLEEFQPKIVCAWMNRAAQHTPKGDWILVGRLGGYYDLKYYQACDHLVGNTQAIVDWVVKQGWSQERAHYLPNFSIDLKAKQNLRPNSKVCLLSAGRLHPNKGFDTLILALKQVPQAHLLIAGDGPERTQLESLIVKENLSDRVRLLGWNYDMQSLFAESDIFICPSRHEPLGNVIIEAFSAQKPVIATRSDGALSLISHAETGLLAEIDNPFDLAQQINRVVDDLTLRENLATNARREFELKFSEKIVVQQWQAFFHQLEKA